MKRIKINEADLSVRSKNYLEKIGYQYIDQVDPLLVIDLNWINFGKKTKQEILDYLFNKGE